LTALLILAIFLSSSAVRDQFADFLFFAVGNVAGLAKAAQPLGGFLGQNVALVSLTPLDLAGFCRGKAFGRSAMGF